MASACFLCLTQAKNGFYMFKPLEKSNKSNILWYLKIIWNSDFIAINKDLLEHSHTHLYMDMDGLLLSHKHRIECFDRLCDGQSRKYLLAGTLQKITSS